MDYYIKLIIILLIIIILKYLCNCKENYDIELFINNKKNIKEKTKNNNELFSKKSNIQSGYSNEDNIKMKIIQSGNNKNICGKEDININDKILKLDYELEQTNWNNNIISDVNHKKIENIIYMNNVGHCDFL
jgi:hypothetical protein